MKTFSKLDMIRGAAKALSIARTRLSASVAKLTAKVDAAHRQYLPQIRKHVGAVADADSSLRSLLQGAPELFREPRSITENGIKFGYQGHDASVDLPKAKAAVAAIVVSIKEIFTAEEIRRLGLIQLIEVPVADKLLKHCTPEQLAVLGVPYTAAGDHILVKPADAAVDKLVAKLLKAATDEADQESA